MVIENGSCKVFFIFISAALYVFSENVFENWLNPCIDTPIVGVSLQSPRKPHYKAAPANLEVSKGHTGTRHDVLFPKCIEVEGIL